MLGKRAVDVELRRSLGLSMKDLKPLIATGGDLAEKTFMECCWCLWKADGAELVEPFVNAVFNDLPATSRAILFQRMLTLIASEKSHRQARLIEIDPSFVDVSIRRWQQLTGRNAVLAGTASSFREVECLRADEV